jgi:hypothetical protein
MASECRVPVAHYGLRHPVELEAILEENLCYAHCHVGMADCYEMDILG